MRPEGAIAVLRGNLAPSGAILKTSAASHALMNHVGDAVVFENYADMLARIEDPDLQVTPDSVLVLKNCGPKGVPGMPEWGSIPIPAKLQRAGVTDMVRISDSRMSGTSYGTVILHVAPEAAARGPLAIVRTGDSICLNVHERKLDLLLSEQEISRRLNDWQTPPTTHLRGYPRLYIDHVLQADQGCDFDFLRPENETQLKFVQPVVGRS
jgi:dihydroxyacid dehydratase/phosphogluconate dehydratase